MPLMTYSMMHNTESKSSGVLVNDAFQGYMRVYELCLCVCVRMCLLSLPQLRLHTDQ